MVQSGDKQENKSDTRFGQENDPVLINKPPNEIEELNRAKKIFSLFSSSNRILAFNEYINGVKEEELYELYGEYVSDQTIQNNIVDFYDIDSHYSEWRGEEIIYHTNEQDNPLSQDEAEKTKDPLKHNNDNEYQLTPIGEHIAQVYNEMISISKYYFDVIPLLRHFDSGWWEILGREELQKISAENITEYSGKREASTVRTKYNRDIISESSTIREMLTWNPHENWKNKFVKTFTDSDTTGELILRKSEIVDLSPENGGISKKTAGILSDNGADLYVYDGDYPCVLFIGDSEVTLWGWGPGEDYSDAGVYTGGELYSWAEKEFDRIKKEADPKWENYNWLDNPNDDIE